MKKITVLTMIVVSLVFGASKDIGNIVIQSAPKHQMNINQDNIKQKTKTDRALGGGYIGSKKPTLESKKAQIERYMQRLKTYEADLHANLAIIHESKGAQQIFLERLQRIQIYMKNYINEKGSCFILEDDLAMNPPQTQYEIDEVNKDIDKCYERADFSLTTHGDIMAELIASRNEMEALKRVAERKVKANDGLNKSIITLQSLIDTLHR